MDRSMSTTKRSNSMKNMVKKLKEFTSFNKKNVPYRALNTDCVKVEKLERKQSSTRWRNQAVPQTVPHGCLAVYAGEERRRFVIPTDYLSHPVFLMLLEKAREEYGFKQQEGLTVPCDVEAFEHLLWLIQSSQSASGQFDLETLVNQLVRKGSLLPEE